MHKATSVSTFKRFGLTHCEADVLLWIARGQSNAEIAINMRISPPNFNEDLEHVFSELGVTVQLAATVRAGAACSAR
jgi:DNA-binding CsgD family transcriptional regulator